MMYKMKTIFQTGFSSEITICYQIKRKVQLLLHLPKHRV